MTHNLERFQHGMAVLLEKLGPTHPRYQEVLDYQCRLECVVAEIERDEESVDTRTELEEILTDCDQLSRMTTEQSFVSCCLESSPIETVIMAENIGVVGDHAHIEGGIHHHVPGETVNIITAPSVWARWREKYPWRFYPALTFGILLFLILGVVLAGTLFVDVRQVLFVHGLWPGVFPKAQPGETLIIVADFEQRGGSLTTDPAQYIYEQLQAQVEADNLDVRVERLRQVVDDTTARPTGKAYRATLLLWGWYTGEAITPRLERLQLETLTHRSTAEKTVVLLAEPETLAFKTLIVENLPDRATYLVFFTLGLAEYVQGDYGEAQYCFESALVAAGPGVSYVAETYFYQGNLYYFGGAHASAIEAYTHALELDLEYVAAYNNRGINYNAMSEYAQAEADYTRALALNPEYAAGVYINRGGNYNAMGEYVQAEVDFTRALELDPEYVDAYTNRGLNYNDMGEYEKAEAAYTRALELNPEDVEAYYNRGNNYHAMGEYEKAEADYTRALELDPEDVDVYYNRGTNHYAVGEYEKAVSDFTRALELDPEDVAAYNNRGNTYSAMGEYALALSDFTRALELDPEDAVAYYNRGIAYASLSKYSLALPDFTRALELDPEYVAAYNNRGNTYSAMGEYALALSDFTRALELDPENTETYYNRGTNYYDMGEYEKANVDYTRALELDPEYVEAYTNRGNSFAAMGEYEKAEADYTRALELDPDFATAYYNRGVNYNDMGEYALALADFESALVLMPYPFGYYNGAFAHARLGHITEACVWLEMAIALAPSLRDRARTDPAFGPIRIEPCFQALMDGAP